jgi:hypothetical protein
VPSPVPRASTAASSTAPSGRSPVGGWRGRRSTTSPRRPAAAGPPCTAPSPAARTRCSSRWWPTRWTASPPGSARCSPGGDARGPAGGRHHLRRPHAVGPRRAAGAARPRARPGAAPRLLRRPRPRPRGRVRARRPDLCRFLDEELALRTGEWVTRLVLSHTLSPEPVPRPDRRPAARGRSCAATSCPASRPARPPGAREGAQAVPEGVGGRW